LEQAEILSANQADLPNGWVMVKVASLCEVVRGGSPRPAGDPRYYGGDIPFLKVADLTRVPGMRISGFTYTIT
jgi:type I restriction enzyme S subunit